MIEVKFSLELTKNGVQKCIHAKSGEENSRKAVITLTENGKVFDAAGYYVKVYFDNGKHVDTEDDRKLVTVENGCVGFVIPYDLVAEEGERLCEVQISKDKRILYSPVFKVLVEQSLGQHGVSEPVGDITRYQEVIPDLMSKDDILLDDEIAVYTPEDELTTKRKVSSLPFGKKLENEAQIERINASDVDEIKQLSNGKYAEAKDVPTKLSQLTNDKNFVDVEKVESMIEGAHENESPIVTSALAMVSMLASETIIASIEAPNEASKITSKFARAIKQVTVRDVYYSPSATGVLEFRDAFGVHDYKIDVTQGKTYRFSSEGLNIVIFEVGSIEEIEMLTGIWRDYFDGTSGGNMPPGLYDEIMLNTEARHTHINIGVLDKFDLDENNGLLFDGQLINAEDVDGESIAPRATMAQTVALLLEQDNVTNVLDNAPDAFDANVLYNLYEGLTFLYVPPTNGTIAYLDPTTGAEITLGVVAGGIYEFYIDYATYALVRNNYTGVGVLEFFKSKLLADINIPTKEEIVADVLNALPTWNGGAY